MACGASTHMSALIRATVIIIILLLMFLCRCAANWFGDDCGEFVCDRKSDLCENGGTCVMHPTNFSAFQCICPSGFLGDTCQYELFSGQ